MNSSRHINSSIVRISVRAKRTPFLLATTAAVRLSYARNGRRAKTGVAYVSAEPRGVYASVDAYV